MTTKDPQSLRNTLSAAAESVHLANYQTLPHEGAPGLEFPADVYSAIGNLKALHGYETQLLRQLSLWLGEQNAAGKVGTDDPGFPAALCTSEVRGLLDAAEEYTGELMSILGRAHAVSSHLKAAR